jgi:hypothetical protein
MKTTTTRDPRASVEYPAVSRTVSDNAASASASASRIERTCLRCGYDLRGLEARRCPECGLPFDPDAPPPPAVPWVRRHEIGAIRAYFSTVALVVLRPRKFAEQAWRWTEFDPEEGESFRRRTVLLAAFSPTVALIVGAAIAHRGRILEPLGTVASLMALPALAFFSIATLRVRVAMPLGRSPDVERRFAYLQKFCCAGLGLMAAAPVFAMALAVPACLGWVGRDAPVAAVFAVIPLAFAAWIAGCGMYLIFGGRVSFRLALAAVVMSVGLWLFAIAAAVIVMVAQMAILKPFDAIG